MMIVQGWPGPDSCTIIVLVPGPEGEATSGNIAGFGAEGVNSGCHPGRPLTRVKKGTPARECLGELAAGLWALGTVAGCRTHSG